MDIRGYAEVESKIEELSRKAERAKGAMGELKRQLKEKHNVSDLKAAEKALESMKAEEESLKKERDDLAADLIREWGEKCQEEKCG